MRNILTVFIASPSDLAQERQRAFDVVGELNDVLRSTNWAVELLGWEDTLPGYGRPQALINRDVERCDLFVGAVWRRWGTPPAQDSTFSSGFEEEFSVALKRRERTASPEIWVFFKEVDAAQVADAGAQLQRVLAFRESLITSKTVLFKEFDGVEAWEKMLRTYLLRHVLDLSGAQSTAPERPSGPASTTASSASEVSNDSAPAAGEQIAMLARSLEPAFVDGDLDAVATSLNDFDETAFIAVRALLLSMTLVGASRTSASLMPTHELNTLYRYRERLSATDDELYLVFRTLLADQSDISPGWFWLRGLSTRQVILRLLRIILYDDNSRARALSFSVLRQARIRLFEPVRDPLLTDTLPSLPAAVQEQAWAYLLDVATAEDVKILGEASGTWLESRVGWLRTWLDAARNLDDFLPTRPDPQFLSEPIKELIAESITKLSDPSLEALSEMFVTDLTDRAKAEMTRRGTAAPGDRPKVRRRRTTLGSLLDYAAFSGPETDDERYERLRTQTDDELSLSLDWYALDGRTSYQLLAERAIISREMVRADIDSAFRRVRESSDQSFEKKYGVAAAAKAKQEFAELNDFITHQFTAKAMAALAVNSTPDDAPVARKLLNNDATRSAALEIIAASGDATDVERLLEIARLSFGDDRATALKGIRRLTSDKLSTARVLLAAEGRDARRAGLALLRDVEGSQAVSFLEELMSHEDEEVRLTSVALLRLRLESTQLLKLLQKYIGRESYYYNVVAWCDRLLYAPEPISDYYTAALERTLKEATA